MSNSILTLLLPMGWAATSAIIAIALYRTSAGWFSHDIQSTQRDLLNDGNAKTNNLTKKRTQLRIAGSAVTAGLAFYGLWFATKDLLGTQWHENTQIISAPAIQGLIDASDALVSQIGEAIPSCLSETDRTICEAKLTQIHRDALTFNSRMKRLKNEMTEK